jgi:hypothetical protein
MKNGIVLLTTLMFIILITALVAVSFSNFEKMKNSSVEEKTYIQTNFLLMDTLRYIKKNKILEDIDSPEKFKFLLDNTSYIPMEFGDYKVLIQIEDEMGKYNINSINLYDNKILFNNIRDKYKINDIDLLLFLIKHGVIDKKNKDLFSDIEMSYPYAKLYSFGKGKIVNIKHFNQILDFYYSETKDNSVYSVPWDKILRFDDPKSFKIDINYISPDLLKLIMPDINDENLKLITNNSKIIYNLEDLGLSDDDMTILKQMNVSFFEKELKFELNIISGDYSIKKEFYYDIDKKKVYNFR